MRSIRRALAMLALSAVALTMGGCTTAPPTSPAVAPSAAPITAEVPRDHAAEARLRVAWATIVAAAANSAPEMSKEQAEPEVMTAEDCDEFAMSSDLSNAELNPELRSIGCGWRLDQLEAQAIEDSLEDCDADPYSSPHCPGNEGMDGGYDAEDPGLNVGPDGYCTATPCGSNGTMPELTCTELGVEEQFCQPDGTYQP